MLQRSALTIAALVMGSGCVTARIVEPDVTGPHGEHLVELECTLPDKCMALARQTCGGDFDVVTSNDSASGGAGMMVTSSAIMLVHCQNPPPHLAPAAPSAPAAPGYTTCASTFDCTAGGTCIGGWCRR